jgi:xanthosine utilization system XapX-like protein
LRPSARSLSAAILHLGVHVGAARALFDGRAMQTVQQHVAVAVVVGVVRPGAIFQRIWQSSPSFAAKAAVWRAWFDWVAPCVITIVGALGLRLGHQEFQLARLVSARGQAGAVVALDPDLGPAQLAPTAGRAVPAASADAQGRCAGSGPDA